MLAEMAAFNAAFGIVKGFIQNGRDLQGAFGHIAKMVDSKEELQKKAHKRKNSFMSIFSTQDQNDWEEFLALDKMREAEKELESMMKLYGRPGLWDDWVSFRVEAQKKRRQAEKERQKKLDDLKENLAWIAIIVLILGAIIGIGWLIWMRHNGLI
jgi:hypothetical protein